MKQLSHDEFKERLENLAALLFSPANKYAEQYAIDKIIGFIETVSIDEYEQLRKGLAK